MFNPLDYLAAVGPLLRSVYLFRLKADSQYSIADYIEGQVKRYKNRPFILFEDQQLSYCEYNALANQFAHWALSVGLRTDDTVGLMMGNRAEYVAIWSGLSKVGIKTALINSNLKGQSIRHALEVATANHLILGPECAENIVDMSQDLRNVSGIYVFPNDPADSPALATAANITDLVTQQPKTDPDRSLRRDVHAADSAFYVYTSGTTGFPKAAKFNHQRLSLMGLFGPILGLGRKRVVYCPLPLYHGAGGVGAVMMAMGSGGTVAIAPKFSASKFWDDIRRFNASVSIYIGELCRFLLNQPASAEDGNHNLKFMFGLGIRTDIWETFQTRFRVPRLIECYGATEGNLGSINFSGQVGSVGKIRGGMLLRYDIEKDELIKDPGGRYQVCKVDEVGELVSKIPRDPRALFGQFQGYTDSEQTEKKILRDVKYQGDAYFRSGDLLRCDAQGFYYFVDRIGDTFRWKGENVATDEVAQALSSFASVETVNAYGVEVEGHEGRAGMVALAFRDGEIESFDGAAFYELAVTNLPAYAVPIFVRLQLESEVTSTLKLRKVSLRNEGFDPSTTTDPIYIRDDESRAYVELRDLNDVNVR